MTRNSPVERWRVVELTQEGKPPEWIADRLGCDIRAVYRAQDANGVGQLRRKGRPRKVMPSLGAVNPDDLGNPIISLSAHFGDRLTQIGGAFRLDGRPSEFFTLMRQMNGDRKRAGQEQVGHRSLRV